MKKIALVGNPNSGKTTLFNKLTGLSAKVSNWPGVTVEKKEGIHKIGEQKAQIIDLPGIYSLSPYTNEEVIARNYIINEKPDCVVNIIDGTNLERNMYLTTQILEMDVPMVVAINFADVVKKEGEVIDAEKISKALGVPVVSVSALKNENLDELVSTAFEAAETTRAGVSVIKDEKVGHLISDIKIALESKEVASKLFHAVKLAEGDEIEAGMHSDCVKMVKSFTEQAGKEGCELDSLIAGERYAFIESEIKPAITSSASVKVEKVGNAKLTKSDKADKFFTNKWIGIPLFIAVIFAVFHLTFSEDFLYLGAMGVINEDFLSLEGTFFEGLFGEGGINSPGIIFTNFIVCILDGIMGGVASGMEAIGASDWVVGLVVDGVFGGAFAVIGFVPLVLSLMFFLSLLEDCGYMARVSFMLDGVLRKVGISGRAVMPMVMGFGCSIPAMMATRTIADEKEKTITLRIIPFFSCGAKLPILTAIAGGILGYFGVGNVDLITMSMYLLGICVAIICALVLRSTTLKGDGSPFIMELPEYRVPSMKAVLIQVWEKGKHFIYKAFTIILASTVIIWVISHFSPSLEFLADEEINNSILANIGKSMQVLFTPMGFGSQLGEWGWVFAVTVVCGLIAKENVVAVLAVLAAAVTSGAELEEVEGVVAMIEATGATVPALLAFIAFNMTTIPCFAAVASAKAELGKGQLGKTLGFWLLTSYIVGMVVYLVGEYVWPIAIVVAAIAGFIVYLAISKKKQAKVTAV